MTIDAEELREFPAELYVELGVRPAMAWADQDPLMQALLWWDGSQGRFLSVQDDRDRY